MTTFIHPTALVSPMAQIDSNVKIGPFCVIEDNVIIESGAKVNSFIALALVRFEFLAPRIFVFLANFKAPRPNSFSPLLTRY